MMLFFQVFVRVLLEWTSGIPIEYMLFSLQQHDAVVAEDQFNNNALLLKTSCKTNQIDVRPTTLNLQRNLQWKPNLTLSLFTL